MIANSDIEPNKSLEKKVKAYERRKRIHEEDSEDEEVIEQHITRVPAGAQTITLPLTGGLVDHEDGKGASNTSWEIKVVLLIITNEEERQIYWIFLGCF